MLGGHKRIGNDNLNRRNLGSKSSWKKNANLPAEKEKQIEITLRLHFRAIKIQ